MVRFLELDYNSKAGLFQIELAQRPLVHLLAHGEREQPSGKRAASPLQRGGHRWQAPVGVEGRPSTGSRALSRPMRLDFPPARMTATVLTVAFLLSGA